jgi:hypothetical protein
MAPISNLSTYALTCSKVYKMVTSHIKKSFLSLGYEMLRLYRDPGRKRLTYQSVEGMSDNEEFEAGIGFDK